MTIRNHQILRIAIIGSGFSGSLVAAHLLKRGQRPLEITLFEKFPHQFGRGVAYGTTLDCHLLNVPAGNMSAFPDDPGHFLRWAQGKQDWIIDPPWVTEVGPGSFLPRRCYGDYINELLNEAELKAAAGVRLIRTSVKVSGALATQEGVLLQTADGAQLMADRVVLALGNFPPGDPYVAQPDFYESSRYHGNPWEPGLLVRVLETRSCLLIGGGLTMVDWVVALQQAGYQGRMHAISRRGLWPQAHASATPTAFSLDHESGVPSVRAWLRALRRHIRETGCDWRAAIDALRPVNQALWSRLPLAEKRRFLRHLRPWWDCHRHRLSPVIAGKLQQAFDSGQLTRHVGRILEYRDRADAVEVVIRPRGVDQPYEIEAEVVLNCSGSESDYRQLGSPLIKSLLDQGLIRPDALRLGLEVARDGALIQQDGEPSNWLFSLGPPEKGMLWETTAVPEIRGQAAALAERLLRA